MGSPRLQRIIPNTDAAIKPSIKATVDSSGILGVGAGAGIGVATAVGVIGQALGWWS